MGLMRQLILQYHLLDIKEIAGWSVRSSFISNFGRTDLHCFERPIMIVCSNFTYSLHDIHALGDFSEDSVFSVEPWCGGECDEEL